MKKILFVFLGAVLIAAAACGVVQAGGLSFAADQPHSASLMALIGWARERSLARAVAELVPPKDLVDPARVRRGAGNYDAMCVECHLAPGVEPTEISRGLYPAPPKLAQATVNPDAARRFWIIKHGIKGSGMPAWSQGGMDDAAIWDLVAFLKILPDLAPAAYRQQVAASEGHSHAGIDSHREESGAAAAPVGAAHHHAHAGHTHAH
ncbi:MAG: c-type cytochrome [Bacteroidota bacterium]